MKLRFWGKIFESNCLPKIFDYYAVINENGNFVDSEEFGLIHSTNKEFIFLVARSIDNHDESTVPLVLEVLSQNIKKGFSKDSFQKVMTDSFQIVSEKIRNTPKIINYGASVTVVYVKENKAIIAHIGDNRCYLLRNEIFGQITNDHTFGFELLKSGNEPNNGGSLALLNSLCGNYLHTIDFIELDLQKKDKFILITRQLWLITGEYYSWTRLRKFFSDLFEDSEFITENKEEIIKEFIGKNKFYDSPFLVFQVN